MFREFARHSVIVFIDFRDGSDRKFGTVPPAAYGGFFRDDGRKNIVPRAVITSPDGLEFWQYASHNDLKNSRTYRDIRDLVKDNLESGSSDTGGVDKAPPARWGVRGSDSTYIGNFVSLSKDGSVLTIERGGNQQAVRTNQLVDTAVRYAKLMAEQSKAEKAAELFQFEDWYSSTGVKIRAKFVALDGDQVTIQKEGGKDTFTLPLDRLADGSRKRAAELAAAVE